MIMDLGSRKIVGWALVRRMKVQLVMDALMMAIIIVERRKGLSSISTAIHSTAAGRFLVG